MARVGADDYQRLTGRYASLWPVARLALWVTTAIVLGVTWWQLVGTATGEAGAGGDARSYYEAWQGGLYDRPWHSPHAFVYTPPVGIFLYPFTLLPWPLFYGLLTAVSMACLVYLVGPWAGVTLLLFYPVVNDLASGNIHLIIAAALVAGWWSVILLTKVTPGVSLAYYLAAGEWRRAVYAGGIAALFGIAVLMTGPWGINLWVGWSDVVREGMGQTAHPWALVSVPLTVRLPLALLVAVVAGWRRWEWLLPVSVFVALPAVWVGSAVVLLAMPRLVGSASLGLQHHRE